VKETVSAKTASQKMDSLTPHKKLPIP
jgi:hypothetical protein